MTDSAASSFHKPPAFAVVTGAGGFIGHALLRRLEAAGTRVMALGRNQPPWALPYKAQFTTADITDREAVDRAFRAFALRVTGGEVCVYHLAAESHVGACREDPRRASEINIGGTLNVLEACRGAGFKRIILPSTGLLYRKPRPVLVPEDHPVSATGVYAATKLAGEQLLAGYAADYGFVCTVARLGNVYGPGGHKDSIPSILLRQTRAGGSLEARRLDPIRDFIHCEDVASALVALALGTSDFEVVNVASGIGTSIRSLAQAVCQAAGIPPEVRETAPVTGDVDHLVLDITKARELYAWRPALTLEAGLRATWADWARGME